MKEHVILKLTESGIRDNYLRAIEFRNPEWIPSQVEIGPALWHKYKGKLENIAKKHEMVFGEYEEGLLYFDSVNFPPVYRKGYFKDNWGCVWYNAEDGYEGIVSENPLAAWDSFDTYKVPDFNNVSERGDRDWNAIEKDIQERKIKKLLTVGSGERLFDRLYLLRGFENLMIDIAEDNPKLSILIEMLLEYEMGLAKKWLDIGVDIIAFHTDIGTQNSLMISPAQFRKHIKPMFKELFTYIRKTGTHVYLSSDGKLLEIVDDLIECGISMHDPQFRANTLNGIEKAYKGKICIKLDLDRQMIPFCTPEEVNNHVCECVKALRSDQGGLILSGNFSDPNTPLENIEAMCKAFEEYCITSIGGA